MSRDYAGYFLLLILLTREAFACSVADDYLVPSVAERTSVASHVAVAGFSEVNDRLIVATWLKGGGPQSIEVLDNGFCNPVPRNHEQIIIFLTPGKNPDQFELLSYGFWSGGEEASPRNIKEAKEVLELGLYEYLVRKGRQITVVGIIQDEANRSLQALLRIPGHERIFRVSPENVIHETTSKILEVTSTGVTIEMVTFAKSNLPQPVIVQLRIQD